MNKKSILNYASVVLCMSLVGTNLSSCGNDDDKLDEIIEEPITPSQDEAMSQAKQKQKLEEVASSFMDKMPASSFKQIAELAKYINDTFDDYDWDPVVDWADDIYDGLRQATGTHKESDGWGSYVYNYIYNDYKAVVYASNFTGHFTANGHKWEYEKADDLQFIFKNERGQKCVATLTTSGKTVKVHCGKMDDWVDSDYYSYTSTTYYDRTELTIGVPEKIVVTLTENGDQVVKSTVNIDVDQIKNEEFDISNGKLNVSTLTELNNGYKINLKKAEVNANSGVAVSFNLSSSKESLIGITFTSDISGLPSCNVSDFTSDDFDIDDYDTDDATATNAYVKVDILGKLQIQGKIEDVRKYVDYLDKADQYYTNESKYKSYINQANSLANFNLFYDGTSVKQAEVSLEPFVDETWNGRTYWTVEPVIRFFDGSSYSTFETFFNDRDFKKTIDSFKKLAEQYADLVDEEIYW